jgi:uncharacterized protein (DUF58 family)
VNARSGGSSGVRWTGRAYGLLAIGCGLAAAAVATRDPVPLFVGLPLLLVPFAAAGFAPAREIRADLSWGTDGTGEEVALVGVVRGPFAGTEGDVVVEPAPLPGGILTSPVQVARESGAVRFRVGWRLVEPTIVDVPPPRIAWRDPLGLAERELDGMRPTLRLSRYPAELRRLDAVRLERTIALPGETRSRRLGASGEFYGLRDASPAEPRGRINWRASARLGRLLANDYETDLTGDLLLLLDVRPMTGDRAFDERLLAIARAGVYGLADTLLRTKVRVGYASFGEFLTPVPLSTGRGHRLRTLRAIEASHLAPVAGPAERCAFSLRRFYRPGITTLVVSSWTGDTAEELVPYLRRQGFPPLLVSPSPLPMAEGTGRLAPEDERLARRLERAERQVRLGESWRYGPVIDWSDYWSLEGLARLLRRPARRRIS